MENQTLTVLNCECLLFYARFTPGFEEKEGVLTAIIVASSQLLGDEAMISITLSTAMM